MYLMWLFQLSNFADISIELPVYDTQGLKEIL